VSKEIYEQSKTIGRKIVELGKNKKSFGSFVDIENIKDNKEIMDVFPWCEQGFWSLPMSEDLSIRFENCHEDLSKINNYEMSLLFKHQFGDIDKLIFEHKENNIYYIIIQSESIESLKENYIDITSGFCQDNPYVKIYNKLANNGYFNK